MSERTKFKFHPKCKVMKLTHICFADDLIMYSKWDFTSIYMLLRALKWFSTSYGLEANVQKSAFYGCGMVEADIHRTYNVSGFVRSNLPFRYLGVPICSKKITGA